jgi:hypothetical protein
MSAMTATCTPDVVGRYAVYGRIASGGTAAVHVGRLLGAIGFSRIVAIKRLHPHLAEDPEFLSTMIDEARLASRIHHPNVVSTLDVVAMERELLLVMEYVRGESLARLLRLELERGRRVPASIASAIVIGALHGVHAAHEAVDDRGTPLGIVHRDVSPQNILVGADGVARVIDFGIAKAAGRLQTTREGVLKGKMAYMAPEQLEGKAATRRTDVYAMAVVLWETLAGRRLFRADNDAQLVVRILAGVIDPPSREAPGLARELDALVMKGLAAAPEDRFATAREMADALTRVVPPAFPTTVGAWVEEVARERLALHATMLAEIEAGIAFAEEVLPSSAPDAALAVRASGSRRAPYEAPPFHDGAPFDEEPPSMSHPTNSRRVTSPSPARSLSRVKLAGAIGVTVLLLVTTAGLAWRGNRRGNERANERASGSGGLPAAVQPGSAASALPASTRGGAQAIPPTQSPPPSSLSVSSSPPPLASPASSSTPAPGAPSLAVAVSAATSAVGPSLPAPSHVRAPAGAHPSSPVRVHTRPPPPSPPPVTPATAVIRFPQPD